MRLWSLHPKYLDSKGLIALWRESLLAKHVLEGKTRGYKNHPQLIRFKEASNPLEYINQYLIVIFQESLRRGYRFDKNKIRLDFKPVNLKVTRGQLDYEANHLLQKLKSRDNKRYLELMRIKKFSPHPLFKVVRGDIEEWEIQKGEPPLDKEAV